MSDLETSTGLITVTDILGTASEPVLAERLHRLEHLGRVEIVSIGRDDAIRRRLRTSTDRGTQVAIALERGTSLCDGAVLVIDDDRAIVVRMTEERWLAVTPRDLDAALETGYFVGNLHWRVHFGPNTIRIALEGPVTDYLARLAHLIDSGKVAVADDG